MSEETTTEVELLGSIGTTIDTIANNLGGNRLDRRTFRKYLCDYSDLAASDGQLLDAARHHFRCTNRALFLAQAHMELICWLAKINYTISSTSIKWYSWKKTVPRYRLPLLGVSSQTSHLRSQLQNIKKTADQVYTDLDDANVKGPPTYDLWLCSDLQKDPDCPRFYYSIPQNPGPASWVSTRRWVYTLLSEWRRHLSKFPYMIAIHDLIDRAILAHKQLSQWSNVWSLRVDFLALKASHKNVASQRIHMLPILHGHGPVSIGYFQDKPMVSDWNVCIPLIDVQQLALNPLAVERRYSQWDNVA